MTRDEFVVFLEYLRADLKHDPDSWENPDLEGFLEAMTAYLISMTEGFKRLSPDGVLPDTAPTWDFFAEILGAGKLYE